MSITSALRGGINDKNNAMRLLRWSLPSIPGRDRLYHRAIFRPEVVVPAGRSYTGGVLLRCTGGAHNSAGFVYIGAIYKRAASALLILARSRRRAIARCRNRLYQHDPGKFAGPLLFAVLQFFVVYLLHRSMKVKD